MDIITLDTDGEAHDPDVDLDTVIIQDSDNDDNIESHSIHSSNEEGEIEDNKTIDESVEIVDVSTSKASDSTNGLLLFEIKFHKKEVFQQIGNTIMVALKSALEQNENEFIDIVCKPINDNGICLEAFRSLTSTALSELEPSNTEPKITETYAPGTIHAPQKEQSPDLTGLSELFTIDTDPAEKLDTIKVPSYKRSIKDVLDEESIQKSKKNSQDECKRVRATGSCFNCGSTDHSIRECQKPRNLKRISKAKKALGSKVDRYHVDAKQRFAHIRPGVISDKLQSALNLRPGELPFFFYRMRVLGYPPGWLEEAKVTQSGIMLFNSEGNPVLKPDEDEGEVDALNHKYDVSKIVGFPGFNVDPGKNFFDDYKHHNVPPLNYLHFKEEFIKTLGDNITKGYKRKKLVDMPAANSPSNRPNALNDSTSFEVADMDIEDSEPLINPEFSRPPPPEEDQQPKEIPAPPPATPQPDEIGSTVTSEERSQSPTLEDLEAKHLKLLQELEAQTSNSTEPIEESAIEEVHDLETTQESITEIVNVVESKIEEAPCATSATPKPTTPSLDQNVIKESHMGTPILKFSPYDKLPTGDKFKEGVSDVIFFENLPDSTGKYEHMKVVIQKVRSVVTKLNNEDD